VAKEQDRLGCGKMMKDVWKIMEMYGASIEDLTDTENRFARPLPFLS